MVKKNYNNNALDLFRILATVQVFLGHVITHFEMKNPPVTLVYFVRGVPILFVLCGFLAAKTIEKYDLKEWLCRRIIRIIPAFWACIIVNSLIIAVLYDTKPTLLEGIVYCVTQFLGLNFYTGDWLRGYGVGTPNGVLWTIPVQIQFFLLVPLLDRFLRNRDIRAGGRLIMILTLLSIILENISGFLPEIVNKLISVTVIPYLYFLVAGMFGWYHRDKIIPALQRKKWIVLVTYVVWKVAEIYLKLPGVFNGIMYNTVTTLLMAMVIFAFAFSFTWRIPRDYTFGFYLYHMVFINIMVHCGIRDFTSVWHGTVILTVIVALTMVSTWLSQKFVENPAAKLLAKERK